MKIPLMVLTLALIGGSGYWYSQHAMQGDHNHEHNAASSGYMCPIHPQITSDKPGPCPVCGMDLVSKATSEIDLEEKMPTMSKARTEKKEGSSKYICPMHPQISADHPGSCPVCGMDLVLASDGEQEEAATSADSGVSPKGQASLKLSLKRQQMIGVKIGKAVKKKLFKTIHAPGRVAFDPELYTAQSEFLESLKQWQRVRNSPLPSVKENTRQMIESSKLRLKILGLSNNEIDSLEKKGSQSEGLLVTGKGQENWVYADIFEVDLPYLKNGLSVDINGNFLQGKTLPGVVIAVDQVINPKTRTGKARIRLLKSDTSIRPESYVNVRIFAPVGEHVAVPIDSLLDTGKEAFVFVQTTSGKIVPRKVSVTLETDKEAAIGEGVADGENVVIGANFMLDSESRLKAVILGGD